MRFLQTDPVDSFGWPGSEQSYTSHITHGVPAPTRLQVSSCTEEEEVENVFQSPKAVLQRMVATSGARSSHESTLQRAQKPHSCVGGSGHRRPF